MNGHKEALKVQKRGAEFIPLPGFSARRGGGLKSN